MNRKYVLLTGATGLLGRYLVRDLLLDGHRLAVVVRGTDRQTPAERIEQVLQKWDAESGVTLPRPVVLVGDIAATRFGLSERDLDWVASHCDRLINNAAVISFHGATRADEPWRTNLRGAEEAVALCERTGITEFHHVSTAYVCGTRPELVREDELDCGQQFRNDYEESKFLAEKIVRSATCLKDLTVYRPAIIAGDSKTGYTSTYHGLYHHLRLFALVNHNVEPDADGRRYTPLQLPMRGDEPRNIVPVDWVSAAMCRIFGTPELHGRTYHLAPERRMLAREVMEAGYTFFNSYGVEFLGAEPNTPSELDVAIKESIRVYAPYETTDPLFDRSNLEAALPDLPCPNLDEPMIHRFLAFGERDRWGKRREPRPIVPFWVDRYLHEELGRRRPTSEGRDDRAGSWTTGLSVHGPGGGQWLLTFVGDHLAEVALGLPPDQPFITLSSADFARFVQKNERLTATELRRLKAPAKRSLPRSSSLHGEPGGEPREAFDESQFQFVTRGQVGE